MVNTGSNVREEWCWEVLCWMSLYEWSVLSAMDLNLWLSGDSGFSETLPPELSSHYQPVRCVTCEMRNNKGGWSPGPHQQAAEWWKSASVFLFHHEISLATIFFSSDNSFSSMLVVRISYHIKWIAMKFYTGICASQIMKSPDFSSWVKSIW